MIFWPFGPSGVYYVTFKITFSFYTHPVSPRSHPLLCFHDHMDKSFQILASPLFQWYLFHFHQLIFCLHPGPYLFNESFSFEMTNYNIHSVHLPLQFQLFLSILQKHRPRLFLGGFTPIVFLCVCQPFLPSLPS